MSNLHAIDTDCRQNAGNCVEENLFKAVTTRNYENHRVANQHVRIRWSDALHLNGEQALKRKLLGPGKHRVGHYTATHRLSNSMRNSYGRATCGRTTSGRTTGRTAVRSIIISLQMVVRLLETFEFLRFDANHLANDQTNFKWLSSGAFWLQREFRCLHNALLNSLVPRVPLQSVCQLFFKLCPFQTVCPRGHFEVSPKCPQSWAHHRNSSKKPNSCIWVHIMRVRNVRSSANSRPMRSNANPPMMRPPVYDQNETSDSKLERPNLHIPKRSVENFHTKILLKRLALAYMCQSVEFIFVEELPVFPFTPFPSPIIGNRAAS